ncbi:hypothetical protein GMOD_00008711 [Pyrenophora seminiperda CCB06]|uniref:Uncharacterized protein n=1 Tax=Pyrenophora seminiperda CCB06 TaxID=1302712 RepID=A0A3M7M5W7_9PLEO|nr:hypothetical protein GMOD_00008711 [Pyrenophora seminiperda CCB06]
MACISISGPGFIDLKLYEIEKVGDNDATTLPREIRCHDVNYPWQHRISVSTAPHRLPSKLAHLLFSRLLLGVNIT